MLDGAFSPLIVVPPACSMLAIVRSGAGKLSVGFDSRLDQSRLGRSKAISTSVFLIGKTSGLVMTLCGVLKNILLVLASVLLWGTVILRIQALGYMIAVAGLIYYSVGYDGILAFYASTSKFGKQIWESAQ